MDLLLEIKKFYELLPTTEDNKKFTIEEIEAAAEAVYHGKWKVLTNEIKIGYANETIMALIEQLDKIKEIVKNELGK